MSGERLDVVIVNWNTQALCLAALSTLEPFVRRTPGVHVIVVDNGSTDGSADAVASRFPWVALVRSPENLGYARGNNLGIRQGRAPYVWLLNSDTELRDAEAPLRLLSFLEAHPRCGAVGPALVLPDGGLQTGAAGYDIGLRTAFNYYFFLSRVLPRWCRGYFIDQAYWSRVGTGTVVDWVCGAALMAPRAVLEHAGLVPADHFMYAEDVTLCRTIRALGHEVVYLPSARVTHHHGASSERSGPASTRWLRSVFDEYGRRVGPWRRSALRAVFAAGFLLRAVLYALMYALARRPPARAKSRAMWAYCAASLRQPPQETSRA
jgi:N-acetylglucosaminyl-diphospho-decaprenol L-rhamnosyltransferase